MPPLNALATSDQWQELTETISPCTRAVYSTIADGTAFIACYDLP